MKRSQKRTAKKSPRRTRPKPSRKTRKVAAPLYDASELESKTGIPADWWNEAAKRGDLPYVKRRGRTLFLLSEARRVARGQLDTNMGEAENGEPKAVRDFTSAANAMIARGQPLPPRLAKFFTSKRAKLGHRPPSPRDRDLAIAYLVHRLREQGDSRPKAFKNAEKFIGEKIAEAIDWHSKYEPLRQEVERCANQNRLAGAKTPNPADIPLIRQRDELAWACPNDPISTWAIDQHERGLPMRDLGWSQVRAIYDANKQFIAPGDAETKRKASARVLTLDAILTRTLSTQVVRKHKPRP